MEKHMEIPRKSWIRSINMKCSKQMLTTAPYIVCVYNKGYIYIHIIDKIKNLQKQMENPRNPSWIRSKTWKTRARSKNLIMDKIKQHDMQ